MRYISILERSRSRTEQRSIFEEAAAMFFTKGVPTCKECCLRFNTQTWIQLTTPELNVEMI